MIRNITLDNFKCFKHIGFKLSNLTILTGANGAGKSTVVQALLMLRQSFVSKSSDLKDTIVFTGGLTDLSSSNDTLCLSSDIDDNTISVSIDDDNIDEPFIVSIPNANTNTTHSVVSQNYDEASDKMALFDKSFVYLYANRLSPASHYKISLDPNSTDSRIGDRTGNETAFRIADALSNNEKLPIEEMKFYAEDSPLLTEAISNWLSYIMNYNVGISVDGSREEKDAKVNFIAGSELLTKKMSPLQAAFGFTYILPIITAVLTASKDSLIIVENPEAHLHPQAQLRMGEFLTKAADNGVQIIIETHSDHLINGARIAVKEGVNPLKVSIHFFSKDENNPFEYYDTPIEVYDDGSISEWPDGFFDEWEKALRVINS